MINNEIRGTISGTVIQDREIHGSVYVHPAVDRTRFHPRQLPAPPLAYVQRPIEEQIQIAIDQAHAAHTSALVVLTGPTGVGKSSVAAWFLRRRPWLGEDGDLYVDLRGFSASPPADPRETLEWLLYCVVLDPRSMPPDLPSRAAWWRSKTAGRRLVLLMDDARTVGQVRPLLMGMGRHTIVVTSRALLTALRMDRCRDRPGHAVGCRGLRPAPPPVEWGRRGPRSRRAGSNAIRRGHVRRLTGGLVRRGHRQK